jgi:hypothetical protein
VGSLGVLGGAGIVRTQPAPQQRAAPKVVSSPVALIAEPVEIAAVAPAEAQAAPAPVPAPAPAPKINKAKVSEPAPAPVPMPMPVVPASPPPVPAAVVAPLSPCTPDAELGVVQRAQRWLASSPAEALKQLDTFDNQCADGVLIEERLATRAIALCLADRYDDGHVQLRKLEARNKSSPALTRVREACSEK